MDAIFTDSEMDAALAAIFGPDVFEQAGGGVWIRNDAAELAAYRVRVAAALDEIERQVAAIDYNPLASNPRQLHRLFCKEAAEIVAVARRSLGMEGQQ